MIVVGIVYIRLFFFFLSLFSANLELAKSFLFFNKKNRLDKSISEFKKYQTKHALTMTQLVMNLALEHRTQVQK